MWDFSISKTFGIMAKTWPFIILRIVIYSLITICYVVVTGAGGAIGYGVGELAGDASTYGVWGGIAGFGITSAIIYIMREYTLYLVKAGHIAVIVKLIDNEPLPTGQSQIAFAQSEVKERFGQASLLFGLDQLIKGIIKSVTSLFTGIASFLPIPGLSTIVGIVNSFIETSLTYVDEIILGYSMRNPDTNAWISARQGLVLYAQNGKHMVKNAVWLRIFLWLFSIVIFLLTLAPASGLIYFIYGESNLLAFVLAFIFALSFKAALLEPFAVAALMSVYFKVIEGQEPNSDWDRKLAGASDKFRELAGKAEAAWRERRFDRFVGTL